MRFLTEKNEIGVIGGGGNEWRLSDLLDNIKKSNNRQNPIKKRTSDRKKNEEIIFEDFPDLMRTPSYKFKNLDKPQAR